MNNKLSLKRILKENEFLGKIFFKVCVLTEIEYENKSLVALELTRVIISCVDLLASNIDMLLPELELNEYCSHKLYVMYCATFWIASLKMYKFLFLYDFNNFVSPALFYVKTISFAIKEDIPNNFVQISIAITIERFI